MAQFPHRVDLTDAEFPLLTQELGRTVMVSSFKESSTGEKVNTPQIAYMHNVMPTKRGLVSVGYEEVIPAAADHAITLFTDQRIIYGDAGSRIDLAYTSDGHYYALEPGDVAWRHLTTHPTLAAGDIITVGKVKGISYIHVQNTGTYKYDEVTHDLSIVVLTGIVIAGIIGIVGSSGYLLAYNDFSLAWSSTIDPLDFTPSAITGAGSGAVAGIEGVMRFIVPNSLGLLIYTSHNVVAATYTGNKQYPFKFRPVDNSKGALSLDHIAYESNSTEQYAYTTGGLHRISSRVAVPVLPEVTDFLAGKQLEDFDEVTSTFSVTDLTVAMKKKLKLIASRYLLLTYGITEFTHALVYDIALNRVGKLKLTHVDCFEHIGAQLEVSKESIAFLLNTGAVQVVRFSVPYATRTGVLMLGKFQYRRNRHLVLHQVLTENVAQTDAFSFIDRVALDGINYTDKVGTETSITNSRKFNLVSSGINHFLLFVGKFNLSTLELLFALGGKR